MARLATRSDVSRAAADPRRRQIRELLAPGERSVGELARLLCLAQPQASKHLKVLKAVGLVRVRGSGQQRLYALNGGALKPILDWAQPFETLWNDRFDRLDDVLETMKADEAAAGEGTAP